MAEGLKKQKSMLALIAPLADRHELHLSEVVINEVAISPEAEKRVDWHNLRFQRRVSDCKCNRFDNVVEPPNSPDRIHFRVVVSDCRICTRSAIWYRGNRVSILNSNSRQETA